MECEITINEDRKVHITKSFIGVKGESGISALNFSFPKKTNDIETNEFNKYLKIKINNEIFTDSIFGDRYVLKSCVTKEKEVEFQVILKKDDIVWKSKIFNLFFSNALGDDTVEIPNTEEDINIINSILNQLRELEELINKGAGQNGNEGSNNIAWLPSVDVNSNISWVRSISTTAPTTRNIKGLPGDNGKTPIKGVDYFTESDINSIVDTILSRIPVDTTLQARLGGI